MQGEIYSLQDLERMPAWRATFRHVIAISSPSRFVCLLKKPKKGFLWKKPENEYVEDADIDGLHKAVEAGRLVLVKGKLPQPTRKVAVA